MPTRRAVLGGAIGGGVAVALPGEPAGVKRSMVSREWLALASVPGASWATLRGDEISAGGEGMARVGGAPVTTETLFEAASLSKPVLAAAIHALVGEGLIKLDEPVARRVDFTTDPVVREITPRHLLSHSSGLPNWRADADSVLQCRFKPGTAFRYSGEGYVLLGRLAEAVTGQTAAQVVRSRVIEPAGMTRSSYGWAAGQRVAVAWAHDAGGEVLPDAGPPRYEKARDAGPHRPVEAWTNADRAAAARALGRPELPIFTTPNMAAGLWTTATDYARFLRFARRYPGMSSPAVRVEGNLGWGLGWAVEQAGARRFAWHWGANDGVANLFVFDPEHNQALVVLTNGAGGQRVYERAARVHFAREFDALTWLQP
ncbi:serine hydrolase domain-containing protein [Sphingomonas aerophila]|uniref:CubicO group peptidase (Beta-lactamase class C family) n=1 Tax=Sphingomonas aerophila TaxID=1344948 RepID=A0A7W9EV09_9SPHN|nr:serine hydrolase domain-containing protein [Sphingomonas aerophila]MBB5715819.1 CubicO group peptidase (beta-lactamase class C family) [Sphingomonas aerophila]